MVKKIGLDAGHGLHTNGKQTPDGIKEWSLNDAVCDKIQAILSGYECEVIRTDHNEGEVDEPLSQRVQEHLNAGVQAFVSIHHNAFTGNWNTANGVEVYTDRKPISEDTRLAKIVYDNLIKYTELKGRGIKKANFQVINQNKVPAILVEGGFMDSTIDYKIITSEEGQNNYAKAVADGLIEFCDLQKKAEPAPQPIPTPQPSAPAPRPAPNSVKTDVIYQVHDDIKNKWLNNIVNISGNTEISTYAGNFGNSIDAIYANLTKGNIHYKVHICGNKKHKARWLPVVTNRQDYAGNLGQPIDAVAAYTDTGKTLKYRVHLKKDKRWLPWVTGYDVNNSANGYAGIIGKEIDAIQMYLS